MKIILAQGNPTSEFAGTRHNAGFMALDYYADQHGLEFKEKPKFDSFIAESGSGDEKILLAKPTTYYNETGRAARAIADFYKVAATDMLVIHDELGLPFGTLRTREKGRDAGNNGIKSLNAHMGEDYARVRVGTRTELTDKMSDHDFVLSRFTAEENEKLRADVYPKIAELIDRFIAGDHEVTSHKL